MKKHPIFILFFLPIPKFLTKKHRTNDIFITFAHYP